MSITPTPAATPADAAPQKREITVISHSNLFYWWPVWAVGFVMAAITYIRNEHLVVVPNNTLHFSKLESREGGEIKVKSGETSVEVVSEREAYVLPKGAESDPSSREMKVRISHNKNLGVIFVVVLLLVIVITNVPLRGLWSVIVILVIIALSIIFALAGWWDNIYRNISALDIRINMGGYLTISVALFIAWCITTFFFDRQVYIVFTPGQFKVCTEIGGGEKVFDARGLKLERQKGDIFRHMILGLGSGDLIVKTTGAASEHFDLPNVLFISRRVQEIEDLIRMQQNITAR